MLRYLSDTSDSFEFYEFKNFANTTKLHPASDLDVGEVFTSTIFNGVIFVGMMLSYECLRRKFPSVYASRQQRENKRRKRGEGHGVGKESSNHTPPAYSKSSDSTDPDLPDIYEDLIPLKWLRPVYSVSWTKVQETGGLDAYFFLRYIRMCVYITSVSALYGLLILFPVYASGNNDAPGWYHFSMANVSQGNESRIWIPTLFMYLFSFYVLFIIKQEYKHYMEKRMDFLGKGESDDPQHHYSIMLENIPRELRSGKALTDYFEKLFPGKVHSANVVLKLPQLEQMSGRKLRVTHRLEKAIASFHAKGIRPTHIVGRPRLRIFGTEMKPVGCGFLECAKTYDVESSEEPKKGERVDSIDYYTHDLKELNQAVIEEQTEKENIAKFGNRSLIAQNWLSVAASEYADMFRDDESAIVGWTQWLQNTFSSKDLDSPKDLDSQVANIPENIAQRQVSFSFDDKDKNLNEHKANGHNKYSNREKETETGNYGSLDHSTSESSEDKVGISYSSTTTLGSNASGKLGLLQDGISYSMDSRTNSGGIFKAGSKSEPLLETVPESKREESLPISTDGATIFKKFGAKFGLDFGLYALKLIQRKAMLSIDDETKMQMSSTGFVTFKDLTSTTCAASALLTHKPDSLIAKVAPEARDVCWENIHLSSRATNRRISNATLFLALGALLWSIPLASIQALASADNVAQIPGMEWILTAGSGQLKKMINAYLPVVALLTIILILPVIFEWIAISYEGQKTRSGIDASITSRYFNYQLANIYVTVTAGSLWKSAADIIDSPSAGLEILGNSLPTVVGYFIALLVTKTLAGLPMVILRIGALSRYLVLRSLHRTPYLTQRELEEVHRVEPIYYGYEYPTLLLVIVICFTYACISPVILIFGALYFSGALMVYKKQVLYVYTPAYESGGSLFPMICHRTIVGLMCGQLTFMGYSIIRGGKCQPLALVPLIYFSLWSMNYLNTNFSEPSKRLALERAIALDDYTRIMESPPSAEFSREHYKQPVLTELSGEPFFYRSDYDDAETLDIQAKVRGNSENSDDDDEREIV